MQREIENKISYLLKIMYLRGLISDEILVDLMFNENHDIVKTRIQNILTDAYLLGE